MSIGTGLVLLGVWITCAAAWHSRVVTGTWAIILTLVAIGMTAWLR